MNEPVIMGNFSNGILTGLHFHNDNQDWKKSCIGLIAEQSGERAHRRFPDARNLQIDEGFCGNLSGMSITDITSRQWGNVRVEVSHSGQDPGIRFLAWRLDVISDTSPQRRR